MPQLLLKAYPHFFEKKASLPLPEVKSILEASFHPRDVECAIEATAILKNAIAGKSFTASLYEHSPGLKDCRWDLYLEASTLRVAMALRALRDTLMPGATVIDMGSFFGNFSLAARLAGYNVTAIDFYEQYGENFTEVLSILLNAGVHIADTATFQKNDCAEAVLLMGVIEHIPHSPKKVLRLAADMLKAGGILVLDTPNIAYVHNRRLLMSGVSPLPAIQCQYTAKEPFSGHHREFIANEVTWMLEQEGISTECMIPYNYSYLSNEYISESVWEDLLICHNDPSQCEVNFFVGKKKSCVKEKCGQEDSYAAHGFTTPPYEEAWLRTVRLWLAPQIEGADTHILEKETLIPFTLDKAMKVQVIISGCNTISSTVTAALSKLVIHSKSQEYSLHTKLKPHTEEVRKRRGRDNAIVFKASSIASHYLLVAKTLTLQPGEYRLATNCFSADGRCAVGLLDVEQQQWFIAPQNMPRSGGDTILNILLDAL